MEAYGTVGPQKPFLPLVVSGWCFVTVVRKAAHRESLDSLSLFTLYFMSIFLSLLLFVAFYWDKIILEYKAESKSVLRKQLNVRVFLELWHTATFQPSH